jgi:SAM-dependent methyltransferase
LPPDRFDLVVGWSVFSHLSPDTAAVWLEEMVRTVRKGGYCVFTTWGERFLDRLIGERDELVQGRPIDWYSQQCLNAAGDIAQRRERYRYGEYVWFTGHQSTTYGEAFLPPPALRRLLQTRKIKLELVEFDQTMLAQDVFVLRRL